MLKKNNFFFGFSVALLVTAVMFGALYLLNTYLLAAFFGRAVLRESTTLLVALGANIFVLNYYLNRRMDATAKGMVAFVFVCAAYIIYTYYGADLGLKKPD